ncbi:MAG: lipase maturation factor family protein [Nitrospinia bacterium]|tara:strand:+ start:2738 stop:4552 length:1815 start_codon:yes stop_codon:yes gene_type:complete
MPDKNNKPVLIYDDDCGFCRFWVSRWKPFTQDTVIYKPSQGVAENYPQISPQQFKNSVYFVASDGSFCSGAQAVFKTFANAPNGKWLLRAYEKVPGFASVSEWGYRQVAENRQIFSTVTRWFWGSSMQTPTWFLTRRVFLFLLGLVYILAFGSLWIQIEGLVGEAGILPAELYLKGAETHWGAQRFWQVPTLFWLNAGNEFLYTVCLLGAGASLMVMVNFFTGWALLMAWIFYLSIFNVAQPFLGFQWDTLLLETGFLSLFLVSWRGNINEPESSPSWFIIFLLRLLLFRVVFSSGVVKLLSQDPTWADLTALYYHYETQPLPTWVGWYTHQLPQGFQEFSVVCVFVIQLGVVFLIFGPRRIRYIGCAALVFFDVLIILTGNYGFFNLLTIALCLLLLDDSVFSRWLSTKGEKSKVSVFVIQKKSLLKVGLLGVCIMLYAVPLLTTNHPSIYVYISKAIRPFHIFNSYGLFAVMTTSRPEIIILGSDDRENWFPYEFKWKPGNVEKKPKFVAPHQPRLDWQMWFAALSNYERNPWLIQFMTRLLQGSPVVIALLENNPFPDTPPRYLQAVIYEYQFTNSEIRNRDNSWWTRKLLRPYTPILRLP